MISAGPDFKGPPQIDELRFIFLILVLAACVQVEADFVLTSWYRTPDRNRDVGGVANSLHLQGLAIDVVGRSPSLVGRLLGGNYGEPQLATLWRSFGSPFFQAVQEDDHVHLELDLN